MSTSRIREQQTNMCSRDLSGHWPRYNRKLAAFNTIKLIIQPVHCIPYKDTADTIPSPELFWSAIVKHIIEVSATHSSKAVREAPVPSFVNLIYGITENIS